MLVRLTIALREDLITSAPARCSVGYTAHREHRRPVRNKADLRSKQSAIPHNGLPTHLVIPGTAYDAKLNKFRLQPSPMRLAPNNNIVVRIDPI